MLTSEVTAFGHLPETSFPYITDVCRNVSHIFVSWAFHSFKTFNRFAPFKPFHTFPRFAPCFFMKRPRDGTTPMDLFVARMPAALQKVAGKRTMSRGRSAILDKISIAHVVDFFEMLHRLGIVAGHDYRLAVFFR